MISGGFGAVGVEALGLLVTSGGFGAVGVEALWLSTISGGLGAVVDLGGSRRLGCRGFGIAFGDLGCQQSVVLSWTWAYGLVWLILFWCGAVSMV